MQPDTRSTADILRAARKRIEDPKHWCRGALAKTSTLHHSTPSSPKACRWCAYGALQAEGLSPSTLRRLFGHPSHLIEVNDDRLASRRESHKHVLAMFDRAIEEAEDAA